MIDSWPRIRADVKAVNRRIEALLQQIDPVSIAGTKVTLVSPYEFHRNRVNTDEVRIVIEEVIGRIFREKVTVSCVTKEEAAALAASQPAPRAVAVAEPAARVESVATAPTPEPEPEPAPTVDDDEKTFQAVRNIFDAEEEDL
jgi:DNA polymerase-3 subunit gamma/tau